MTLGRCRLSIFCSRGTPPKSVEPTNPESINAGIGGPRGHGEAEPPWQAGLVYMFISLSRCCCLSGSLNRSLRPHSSLQLLDFPLYLS